MGGAKGVFICDVIGLQAIFARKQEGKSLRSFFPSSASPAALEHQYVCRGGQGDSAVSSNEREGEKAGV